MVELSIIVVTYNTVDVTIGCLSNLLKILINQKKEAFEVIVVDNASSDDTVRMLEKIRENFTKKNISFTIVLNSENVGFSKGCNKGAALAKGRYLLFLNSDVLVEDISFKDLFEKLDRDPKLGALTAKVVLPDGSLDKASHRGFPTLWRSISYFVGLEKLLGNVPFINHIFGGYHLTYRNINEPHEIDSPTGAFYLVKKKAFQEVHGFDESFFMYGEDLDLSLRIRQAGYKIIYDPTYTVTHLKYQSGLKSKDSDTKRKTNKYFYDAMKIFYKKHYAEKIPTFVNSIVYWVIDKKTKHS